MTPAISFCSLAEVRRKVAVLILGDREASDHRVGNVELWPHQRDAVTRVRASLAEFGGALLADDVGTGKTFVALAVASRYVAPLVVAPAALRETWRLAAERAGRTLEFLSFESLSRGRQPSSLHDIVIVDEAHHARNPGTKRYGALATLIAGAPALLLTATPIHNHRNDLVALLALFLGATATALDDAALARCVVRRDRKVLDAAAATPIVRGPTPLLTAADDDETPDAILALPPPVPAVDAGTAPSLLAITLLRQWASSQGALLAAVRRRLASAHALSATLDGGRYPTRAELAAWTLGDDAQQLVMSELLAPASHPVAPAELRAAVAAHIEGLRALRRAASADPEIDRRRARELREAWAAHPGARSIAFTQFAETVDAYWRELRGQPRVCALNSMRGRVAGGTIPRRDALGGFSPGPGRLLDPAHRIDHLVVTDLASEGLDLQEASVLVHLDLPWTPARLEQRVGRIVRPGSAHDVVHVYTMEPPVRASALLDIRRRLAEKLAAARAAFGDVMPDIGLPLVGTLHATAHRLTLAAPVAAERIECVLRRWLTPSTAAVRAPAERDASGVAPTGDQVAVCVVRASSSGWLAVVGGDPSRLVAALDDQVSDNPALVAEACALVDALAHAHAATNTDPTVATGALRQLTGWLESRRAASLAGVPDIPVVRGRRRILSSIAALANAPGSARYAEAPAAGHALSVASRPLPASLERMLATGSPAPSVAALATLPARQAFSPPIDRVQAMIVFAP